MNQEGLTHERPAHPAMSAMDRGHSMRFHAGAQIVRTGILECKTTPTDRRLSLRQEVMDVKVDNRT